MKKPKKFFDTSPVFEKPFYLLFLWLIPIFAVLIRWAFKRKRAAAERFLEQNMVERLFPRPSRSRAVFRGSVLLIAMAFLFLAVGGPRFGVSFEEVRRSGSDVFVLLDVSRSMLAEDVPPNRLQRAKSDIEDLLNRLGGDRVGLIVFAGKPIVKVPLTTDQGFFLDVLKGVDPNSAPRGGTAIGDAIRKALDTMPTEADRDQAIVLITDGDDQDSMPLEAAQDAAARNIRILCIGLGDPTDGGRIPIRDDAGNKTFLKHEGREVWSKVDEQTLREIATTTGGLYVPASGKTFDLGQIYVTKLGRMQGNEYLVEHRQRYREQYQIFLAVSVTLLFVYLTVPEYRSETEPQS